jgi:DNA-binding NarL/FixJ family response regulator
MRPVDIDPVRLTSETEVNRKRVLIVDDHPMTRSGLVHLINHQPDLEVCGEVENAAEALEALTTCKPDLALIDVTLPDKSGLELIKISRRCSQSNSSPVRERLQRYRCLRCGPVE